MNTFLHFNMYLIISYCGLLLKSLYANISSYYDESSKGGIQSRKARIIEEYPGQFSVWETVYYYLILRRLGTP